MLAAMHGRTDCMLRLLDARTCLHHEAYYPMAMPTASKSSSLLPRPHRWPTHGNLATGQIDMAASLLACRGFARFVNVRDEHGHGTTPLHLAARQGRP